jgi:hypothetical protein
MWDRLTINAKLNMLSGESMVEIGLLAESDDLITLLRSGASYQHCLEWVAENF